MTLIQLLESVASRLERRIERRQRCRDEAYLARATDHADLERRQRALGRPRAQIPYYG